MSLDVVDRATGYHTGIEIDDPRRQNLAKDEREPERTGARPAQTPLRWGREWESTSRHRCGCH
jgi:hypothetical protein